MKYLTSEYKTKPLFYSKTNIRSLKQYGEKIGFVLFTTEKNLHEFLIRNKKIIFELIELFEKDHEEKKAIINETIHFIKNLTFWEKIKWFCN